MRKFIASSPDAQILGQTVCAITESVNRSFFAGLITDYGFDQIDPKGWYPYQTILDFYHVLANRPNGMENFVSIGIKVIDTAILPPTVNNIPAALHKLNGIIDMNMRGPVYDQFAIEQIDERHFHITDHTALPHDLVYGFLYGIANRFRRKFETPVVKRVFLRPDAPDQDGALYDITW